MAVRKGKWENTLLQDMIADLKKCVNDVIDTVVNKMKRKPASHSQESF